MGNCLTSDTVSISSSVPVTPITPITPITSTPTTTPKVELSSPHKYEIKLKQVVIPSHSQKMTHKYVINYPNHEPRKDSPLYRKTHIQLCKTQDLPCWICNKNQSKDQIMTETHHFFIEKAAENAIDWHKFSHKAQHLYNPQTGQHIGPAFDWDQVAKNPTIFVDSCANMIVLCVDHHRGSGTGIHQAPFPDWILQAFAKDGFTFLSKVPH